MPVIDGYEASYSIPKFDRLIDWGWFYFITKPMFKLMDFFFRYFGNFGVAILCTTIVVKALFFPLASKQYASMANMKRMQPKMEELKAKFADDRMGLQQATMQLYKEEKINPIADCWPVALQIPIFFSLYKVIYITIEMRHAPFFGWIKDLSAPDPTTIVNLFGLLPFEAPTILHLGVWPLIMGITMFLQMRMNPTPPDPTQAMIFTWMPLVFMFMLASFPAKPGHLLGLEQHALGGAAVGDHEAPRRQGRTLRQSEGSVPTKNGAIEMTLAKPRSGGAFLFRQRKTEAGQWPANGLEA